MTVLMNPDCLDGKHRACSGDGWCESTDQAVPCPCSCHQPAEHYKSCPCPACVTIRAAQPVAAAMQARHLSGASIGKLVERDMGRSQNTNEHMWSTSAELAHITHGPGTTEIHIRQGATNWARITLHPDDWVRVTAPAAGQEAA